MSLKKILQFSIGPIGAAALGLITLPFVAWLFSPEDIGRLSMLQVVISFTLLLFSLGLDQAYVREFHEVEDKPSLLKAAISPGLIVLSLSIFIVIFIPYSYSYLLFGIESKLLTLILAISIYLSFFSRFLSLVLRMQERALTYSVNQLLPKLIFFLTIVFYFFSNNSLNFYDLIFANLISILTVFCLYLWNTRFFVKEALKSSVNKKGQNRMIKYSLPLIGSGLAFWGISSMDKFFLRGLSGFEQLGIYSLAITLAGVALVFQALFTTIWSPIVYKWSSEGVEAEEVKKIVDYVAFAVVAIWSLVGMFSWTVKYILPPMYADVSNILLLTIAVPLLYTLSEVTGIGIGIKRKSMYILYASISALLINAIGNFLLIPFFGALGAAVSSAIAFMIVLVLKTEFSALVWLKLERKKIYTLLFLMVALSVVVNYLTLSVWVVILLYFLMFICSLFFYHDKALVLFRFLKIKTPK